VEDRGTAYAATQYAAMMIQMQDKPVDVLNFYDAGLSAGNYASLFNPITWKPFVTYYGFYAFGEMYHELKNQVQCEVEETNLYALAASDENRNAILIANPTAEAVAVETNLPVGLDVYVIDTEKYLVKEDISSDKFTIGPNQTLYIKNF